MPAKERGRRPQTSPSRRPVTLTSLFTRRCDPRYELGEVADVARPPPHDSSLLDLLEPGWRRHLSAGGLAGTLEIEPTMRDTVARVLGDQSRGRSATEVAHRWPACLVVGLAQVAAASYRNGRFWPGWHRAAGLRATRRSADHWGQAFVEALTVLGLTPPGTGWEAVLVHAAVPDACLPEFLRLIAAGRQAGVDGADADPSGTDPAVAALLRSGGPAVTSFVERCRSTLRLMTAPDRPTDGDRPTGDKAVPRRILDAAEVVAAEVADGPARTGVLRLEPFGRGVLTADGRGQSWRSALPHEVAEQLLVFDEGGEHVGPVLPAEPVWVLHPAGPDLRSDVPPRLMVTSRLPLTWRGWRMAQLDLRGVSWLELEIPDKPARRRYRVRGRLKPRLAAGPSVPGVTTATAAPVHSGLPTVLLPADPGRWRIEVRRAGGLPVRGGQGGRETGAPRGRELPGGSRGMARLPPRADSVLAAITTTAADWRPDQLWQQVSRPVLGTVMVTVAPADRSAGAILRRSVTVAEGLGVAYSPVPRLTSERGLEPAEAVLTAPPGMTVVPQAGLVPAESVTIKVTCVAGPVVLPLRVTPPHLRMRIEPEPGSSGRPTAWHHLGPFAISGSDLRRGGALRLDLPSLAWDPPLEVIARGRIVQVLQPTRQGRYPLRRMLDTVNSHREVSLRITVGGRTAIIAHAAGTADRADPWLPADTNVLWSETLEGSAPWM